MKDKKLLSLLAQKNNYEALINAGYSASDLRNAGYSLSDLINMGYSLSDLKINGFEFKEWDSITPLKNPYTKIWDDIQNKKRLFKQSTWGPENEMVKEENVCNTPMCTAGNLVQLAGTQGWELKQKYGFSGAASIIHQKSCPDLPEQNFGNIRDEWALAYLEDMAEREAKRDTNV